MPYGVIYGTLFFLVVGIWLGVTALTTANAPFDAARLGLALASLALGPALMLRCAWARWLGVIVAALMIGCHIWAAPLGDSVAAHLALFGAVAAVILLLLPATGDLGTGRAGREQPAPRLGRVLGALSGVGLVTLAGGLWLGAEGGSAPDAATATPAGLSDRMRWGSFGPGLDQAREENKPMLVTFVASWCGYCRKMDRTTWKAPDVIDRTAELIAVKVDAEDGRVRDGFSGRDLAERFGVHGFPTTVLLDSGGREIARAGGYQDAGELVGWLDENLGRSSGSR